MTIHFCPFPGQNIIVFKSCGIAPIGEGKFWAVLDTVIFLQGRSNEQHPAKGSNCLAAELCFGAAIKKKDALVALKKLKCCHNAGDPSTNNCDFSFVDIFFQNQELPF